MPAISPEVTRPQRASMFGEALVAAMLVTLYAAPFFPFLHSGSSQIPSSDLRTVLASAWCLSHHIDAYSTANIKTVFLRAGFIVPRNWVGHAPVYPPVTLILLLPFTTLPSEPMLLLLTALWAGLLAAGLTALTMRSASHFSLGLPARVLLILVVLFSPYLLSAMALGNLCIPAASLAVCAFTLRHHRSPWPGSVALGLALALKPHVAAWVLIPMFLLPEPQSRKVAARASIVLLGLCLVAVLYLVCSGQFWMQLHGYRSILASEMSGDSSMSPTTREVTSLAVQITSLKSMVGFWHSPGILSSLVCDLILLACAFAALVLTRGAREERQALLCTTTWIALGLTATYHRAYDGILIYICLPFVFASMLAKAHRWKGVVMALLLVAMSFGPASETVSALTNHGQQRSLESFLLMRQAALADFCLALFLLFLMSREIAGDSIRRLHGPEQDSGSAAV